MRDFRDRSDGARGHRRLDVVRIKVIIVSLGAALSALISCLTGISAQASFTPMLGWMLGFSAGKSQATAMRMTAGAAIACVLGALWRSSIMVVISPGTPARLTQINVGRVVPSAFALIAGVLFIGATGGAILAAKAVPKPDMVVLRRIFLFAGVCIGMYVASEGVHFSSAEATRTALVHGAGALLVLGIAVGALTQILGLASGVIMVPALFYLAGLTIQQSILVSLTVIGLAAILPAWSYMRRGLGDAQYGAAGMIGGIAVGFFGGILLAGMPGKLLLMLFGLMAMFFSAREISILALSPSTPAATSGSDPS
jgi:uncharacterized membrane protein YfcA